LPAGLCPHCLAATPKRHGGAEKAAAAAPRSQRSSGYKEKDNMDNNSTQPITGQPPLPTRELWRALLLVFNCYLAEELGLFRLKTDESAVLPSVTEAIRLLDCWLDTAVQNGWLEGPDWVI
jgi:hypothetical protein